MVKKPASVLLSDKKLKTFNVKKAEDILHGNIEKAEWSWDEASGTCIIRIPERLSNGKIVIEN